MTTHSCCTPGRGDLEDAQAGGTRTPVTLLAGAARPEGLVRIAAGSFLMGSDDLWTYPEDGEGPVRTVITGEYLIDPHCVSNDAFAGFVAATGYVSDAERFGASFVFAGLLPDDVPATRAVAGAEWWREVEGACWQHPEGPGSGIDGRGRHPVVHVSLTDAEAYCAWAGRRLPTEAEWERAARGGLEGMRFPWGNSLRPNGRHRMNVWQGSFPQQNTRADGYAGTAPVDAFPPNGFGLHNMTGNVWEWTADPFGSGAPGRTALRGGSYLCHSSYCRRYRVSARMGSTPDSSSGNVGFRCAADTHRLTPDV